MAEESKQELIAASQSVYGDYWALPIEDFVAVSQGDVSRLGDMGDPTVLQVYWLKGLREFVKVFEKTLQRMNVPKDAQETAAESATIRVSMAEGMLVFVREYFGLHSFEDAGKKSLLDYVMARRDRFNAYMYNKRLSELRAQQHKK